MKEPVVYWIKNRENGKFYVGSTTQRYVRWRTHKNKLRAGTHHCKHLQAAWNKYGEAVFEFSVVERVINEADLEAAEDRWLQQHVGGPHCYNHGRSSKAPWRGTKGMGISPMSGKKLSEEAKQKLREAAKEQWAISDPRSGIPHSPEARAKISAKIQQAVAEGRGGKFIPSEETRAKMSVALKGNQNAKGHVRTKEHRRKLAEAAKGNQHWLGKTHSQESRDKMGAPMIAVAPDGQETRYSTISALCEDLLVFAPTVHRAAKSKQPLVKGPLTGWRFYREGDELPPLPSEPEIPDEYAHLPRTRQEAKNLGAKEYFTDKPCTRGHVAPRVTAGGCTECKREDWTTQNAKKSARGRTDEERAAARRRYHERKAGS
jgi:group I intron endonuclease